MPRKRKETIIEEKIEEKIEETKKKKPGRKKLVDSEFKDLQEIKSGRKVIDKTKNGMPRVFSKSSKYHKEWLKNQIIKLKLDEVESKHGFTYNIFSNIPDELLVKEDSVGKRVVYIEDIDFSKIKGKGKNKTATDGVIPSIFYTILKVNDHITCIEDGQYRSFDFNSVILIESGGLNEDTIDNIQNEEESQKKKKTIKRKK